MIKRDIINQIKPFLNRKEFIAITGPRQSGKTTFLEILTRYLIDTLKVRPGNIRLISFEDQRLLNQFESDPLTFVESYIPEDTNGTFYLMIDEFQYSYDGGKKLKFIYDTLKNLKVIITGSSSLEIRAHVGKYMVGRMLSFTLFPFNFHEYLEAHDKRLAKVYRKTNKEIITPLLQGEKVSIQNKNDIFFEEVKKYYEQYCIWGGYPSVVLARTIEERKKLLTDIFDTYLLKDINSLLKLITERELFLLSQYLATQIGSVVVYKNLSSVSRLDFRQIKRHLHILNETYICKEVRPYFTNRQKELSKNPKIYFLDTGFRNSLLENTNNLNKRTDTGALIENIVFIRLNSLFEGMNKINFWRTKSGAEVDFVVRFQDMVYPFEVKYSSIDTSRISKSFHSFINKFTPPRAFILNKNYFGKEKRGDTEVYFIPAYYL